MCVASLACYTLSMLPNLYYVYKYTGMKADVMNVFGKPMAATALMAAVLYGAVRILPDGGLWTLIEIGVAIAAYAGAAVLVGAITKEDLAPFLRRFGRRSAPKKGE